MTDFILAGLSAGIMAFLALFLLSFVTLGLITASMRLLVKVYRSVVPDRTATYHEQTA